MEQRRENNKHTKARRGFAARLLVICAFTVCAAVMLTQAVEYVLSFRRESMVITASPVRTAGLLMNDAGGRMDINAAAEDDLRAVPGLGLELTRRILALREERGGFHVLEELKDVKGIGDKRFQAMKEYFFCPFPDIHPRDVDHPDSF